MNETIMEVVDSGLCTGCGTCAGVCPSSAIKMIKNDSKGIYLPKLDNEKCSNCGICHKVCPGHAVDFKQLNSEIFGKESKDVLIGNYINCYTGHAVTHDIRYNSSSGGLITQLLIFALEEGMIDGALVTRMKRDRPLEPEPVIARTKEEIIESSKSKYCPVPANIALKEILKSKKGERFAVVGLPCHIHGIRKARQINKKLREKIVLHLGIFCNHTPNFWGTELLLERLHVKKEDVIKLDYRGEGWPGSMKICLKDGEISILLPDYWSFLGSYFFFPNRCLMCSDEVCELADISFGDAWLPEFLEDKVGASIIIVRNMAGKKLLERATSAGKLELNEINVKKVIQSQISMLYFKKKNLNSRIKLLKKNIKYSNALESDTLDCFLALFPYLNTYTSKSFLRVLLKYIPPKIIRLYGVLFSKIYSKKVKKDFKKFL